MPTGCDPAPAQLRHVPLVPSPHPLGRTASVQAYRGPVTKETLHFLYSTKAITPNTYAFSEEHSANRAWTRIRKMPELSEELERPLPSQAPAQSKEVEGSLSRVDGNRNPAASGSGSTNGAQAAASAPAAPLGGGLAPLAADSPMVATPRAEVQMAPQSMQAQEGVKLSHLFTGRSPAAAKPKGGGFFKKKPGKWHFGQPIGGLALDADGVPEALALLRQTLWGSNGHVIEGIFRVSPASSQLKATRSFFESGKHKEIRDMESVAHLVKLWFRELPQSIFAPELGGIVDGTLQTGEQCAELCSRLPEPNRTVVRWLLDLIVDLCRHESDNRMTAQGLCIVFAPNLVNPPDSMDLMLQVELNKRVKEFLELLFQAHNASGGSR